MNIIEQYKNLCVKAVVSENPVLISTLKSENLLLTPDYLLKEIGIVNKLIGKNLHYKTITVETTESLRGL
jgi:hypothetical protein